jgi:hypothetical protein
MKYIFIFYLFSVININVLFYKFYQTLKMFDLTNLKHHLF